MKKLIVLFMLLMLLSSGYAQHLKFEGIPIDGSITNFQKQLSSKGININNTKSKDAPIGQRIFNGRFHGYNSEITVFYGRKSKVVYKVEVVIVSKKKEVIQNILDKTLETIEKKYLYTTDHSVNDATNMIFRYCILPSKYSEQTIGLVQVRPSHSYYLTKDDNTPLEFANYIIELTYEDRQNKESTPPSDLEPHAKPGFTCGNPESFGKFSNWVSNYVQNGCYGRARYYLYWLLDYYKYDCIPANVHNYENGEKQIDELIATLDGCCIGTIPAGVGMEKENVYKVFDSGNQEYKWIEFDAKFYQSMLTNHLKFDKTDLNQLIHSLEELNTNFKKELDKNLHTATNSWSEKNVTTYLPALVGKDNTKTGEFGIVEWNHTQLKAYYSFRDGDLTLNITTDDKFQYIFWFKNSEQIDMVIRFLKTIQL